MGPQRMYSMTPWVRRLLVANLIVFLLQKTVFTSPGFAQVVGFNPLFALQRPWTFFTYLFVHGGISHLAFNMLALYVFGPSVEERVGGGAFIRYYVLCGCGGAALSYGLMLLVPPMPMVGASAAVYGVMLAFAWYWPDAPIYVFPLPEPISAKWLVTFAMGISLLLVILSWRDGVAHLAHLGGFAVGLLYLKGQDWRLARAERHLRRVSEPSVLVHPGPRVARGSAPGPKMRRSSGDPAQAEIDRVLDKISASGMDSLTPAERKFLTEMSRRMRDKR